MGLYKDLLQNHDAKLIAGGAAQNTARGAQVAVPSPLYFQSIPIGPRPNHTMAVPQNSAPLSSHYGSGYPFVR